MKLTLMEIPPSYQADRAVILFDEDADKMILLGCDHAKSTAEEIARVVNEDHDHVEALQRIEQWSKAYPLDIFPEPDFKKAAELLKAGGITLDAISASCMRHVVEHVGEIARKALHK